MLQKTSTDSFNESKAHRDSQEDRLLAILKDTPGGMTDAQVADVMHMAKSQASARRNGLMKRLARGQGRVIVKKVGTTMDEDTRRTCNLWGVRERLGIQGQLF